MPEQTTSIVDRVKVGNAVIPIRLQANTSNGKQYTRYIFTFYNRAGERELYRRSSLDDAKALAKRLLTDAERRQITLVGKDLADYLDAREALPPDFTISQAVRELNRLRAEQRASTTEKPVAAAVAEYLATLETAGRTSSHLRSLRAALTPFGETMQTGIAQLTEAAINRHLASMEHAPRTILNHIRAITALIRWAVARKYAPRTLLDELHGITVPTIDRPEIRIWTPAEMREIITACPPEIRPQLILRAYAGLRTAESQRVEWSQIKLDRGFVDLSARQAKTRERRLAPLTGHAADWLRLTKDRTGPVAYYAQDHRMNAAIVRAVNAARTAAGRPADFVWRKNSLRDSFISYRVAALQNLAQTALEAGNSPRMIQQHYLEVVTPDEAAEYFAISPEKPAR